MPKHTPGPWQIDDGDCDAIGIFDETDGEAIAYLSENVLDGKGLRGREQDDANALLLHAAPEMLAVCKAVAMFYQAPHWRDEERAQWRELTGSEEASTKILGDIARAAVAKAEPNR